MSWEDTARAWQRAAEGWEETAKEERKGRDQAQAERDRLADRLKTVEEELAQVKAERDRLQTRHYGMIVRETGARQERDRLQKLWDDVRQDFERAQEAVMGPEAIGSHVGKRFLAAALDELGLAKSALASSLVERDHYAARCERLESQVGDLHRELAERRRSFR